MTSSDRLLPTTRDRQATPAGNGDDDWRPARNLLCIRLDNLGDVLMSSPALRALKETDPQRRITLLASPSGAALAPYLPDVDAVIPYEAPWVKNDAAHGAEADLALVQALRERAFDGAVIFTVYSQSALPAAMLCRLAGIPRVLAHVRENPYRLVSHWIREGEAMDDGRHEVRRQLDLVATIGAHASDERMRIAVPDEARRAIAARLQAEGVAPAGGYLVVHPGATAASRRWPAQRFAQAIRLLPAGMPVVVTGGADECELARHVCEAAGRGIDLAGRLSLAELIALIEGADTLVSNNSGPVHIAAATGTPVVDLYALTNPQHTPWQVPSRVLNHDVPCRWCYRSVCPEGHHACLRKVTPQAVAEATRELVAIRVHPRRTGLAA